MIIFGLIFDSGNLACDGNNFQWKINVPMRGFAVFCRAALLFARFLLLLCSDFFLSFFILFLPSNIPFAFPALLLSLLCSAWSCSALLDGGAYPFAEKSRFLFLPPKIPAIFSKVSPYQTHI